MIEKMQKQPEFPMRINRYLAIKNYCTRRKADEFISQGRVLINGKKAVLGDKVNINDIVKVSSKALIEATTGRSYFAYHKPVGVLTSDFKDDKDKSKSIKEMIDLDPKFFPVGRLDKDSHGLILLTNDGRITDKLLNPNYDHEKEYVVKVNKPTSQNFLTRMSKGVKLEDGYITKRAILRGDMGSRIFSIIITEGKKHQIRRMVTALGYEVTDLKRVRIMNIKLTDLALNRYREIKGKELKVFLRLIGIIK